jgi:peptidoglycan/LPS O-acetylase OafA/YrhL
LSPWIWSITATCIALFVPYYFLLPRIDATIFQTGAVKPLDLPLQIVESVLTAYLAALLTLLSLLVGQKYLARQSRLLRFLSDASYWIYLVHLPIACFLQILLVDTPLVLGVKLLVTTVGTFLYCMATYLVFVRYTPLGCLLNGRRAFP